MTTLQQAAPAQTIAARPACPIEDGLRRIGPSLMRAAVETSGAFLCMPASLGTLWEAPCVSIPDAMHCSQMNIGEKYQLLCNLTVEKDSWDKLFGASIPDQIKLDAWCELANCICGTILADAGFSDEFGYLLPCVPCNGASRPEAGARTERGSMIVGGAWIHFTFAVRECTAMQSSQSDTAPLSAAA